MSVLGRRVMEVLPEFAGEMRRSLLEMGEAALAGQVAELRIEELCGCGDDFCSTFYVRERPKGTYGPGHRNVPLETDDGLVCLDVVEGVIVCVEVLYRADVGEMLGGE